MALLVPFLPSGAFAALVATAGASKRRVAAVAAALSIVYTAGDYLWYVALPYTSVAEATVLFQAQSVFAVFLAAVLLRERPTVARVLGIAVSLGGVSLVACDGSSAAGGRRSGTCSSSAARPHVHVRHVQARRPIKALLLPIAGRGELIKLIAACGKLELVEGGAELTAEQKLAFGSPGSVPVLEHGDFKLAQSNAIECYVAGLVPKFAALSAQQKATDQMFALIKEDMVAACAKEAFGGKDPAVITAALDKWLAVLESKIPASGFVLGLAYPTVADLAVYNICTGYMPFGAATSWRATTSRRSSLSPRSRRS
ncbi:GTPase [Aureococcus anophagefferens]|nr:GTPase [Aureococcus anophagefferens]